MDTWGGRLARLGFADTARAARLLADLPEVGAASPILADLGTVADPDLAVLMLGRIVEGCDAGIRREIFAALHRDPGLRRRLLGVLGLSQALGEHLVRHPADWRELLPDPAGNDLAAVPPAAARAYILQSVGADPAAAQPVARGTGLDVLLDLRVSYRRRLLRLTAADITGVVSFEAVTHTLAAIADAVLEAGLAIARADVQGHDRCRLSVIAMGKCGAQELNYISDVDVIFVAEPVDGADEAEALTAATRLATALMRAVNEATAEGTIWEVDPNLRPEGKSGALVRTLASHRDYYERWASTWEFQALFKARAAAGDPELGARYVDAVAPLVWSAADRPNFVEDVQAMRRRVERHVGGRNADRQLKLGSGGLRDVEFSVQLLQLVHGRSDVMVRNPNTLAGLESLANWGYIARKDAAEMAGAYRFLRTMEHRLQLHRLRRTQEVPKAEADLRRLGRSMGFMSDPVEQLDTAWRRHAQQVRRLHEKLFYRPLLNAVARLDAGEARLSLTAAGDRLRALGYLDPEGALRHIEALTSGVSRRAVIQRTLLPVMLGWFADTPNPDAALLGFRQVSEELGATPWYLRLLRDESVVAQRMSMVLGTSRYASDLLLRSPDSVGMLSSTDELRPRPRRTLESEALSVAHRHDDPVTAVAAVRALRRRELLRTALADIAIAPDVTQTAAALTDITAAVIAGALQIAVEQVARDRGHKSRVRLAIIAMGRFGGADLGYGSDADVMFVYETIPGAPEQEAAADALALANELRRLLTLPSADPPLAIDADLRPEGRNGPLVRSLASYASYYERWSSPWEAQALLRAEPVAGDPNLGAQFLALIDPLRYPQGGLHPTALREMRRLKARMESERLPRGADPTLHTKLGRGGLSDVEWTVQLLQMQHAAQYPALRTTRTMDALAAALAAGLIDEASADLLGDAWRMATRVRNAVMLARGRASDVVPSDLQDLRAVAAVLRLPPDTPPVQVQEEYRRITRRARRVVDEVFYGTTA